MIAVGEIVWNEAPTNRRARKQNVTPAEHQLPTKMVLKTKRRCFAQEATRQA
jgi:hypothetical protein